MAYERSLQGDHSLYQGDFLDRHSALWRLTEKGEEQARITGEWMRKNLDVRFDVHYTSEYIRAIETSGLLGLPGARWRPEVMLRERDWGEYDLRSQKERAEAFEDYELRRRRESLFWAPPGGESLAQVVQRVVRHTASPAGVAPVSYCLLHARDLPALQSPRSTRTFLACRLTPPPALCALLLLLPCGRTPS